MLEWKTIKLEGKSFIGMHMILPRQGLYVITSTKCIIAGNLFDVTHLSPNVAVCIMQRSKSYSELLESKVAVMNERARQLGYSERMNGKEVLLYQSNETYKKEI